MKHSKSHDNFRKKGSQKEVKIQVFVRIRPPFEYEENDLLIIKDDNTLKSKNILNNV